MDEVDHVYLPCHVTVIVMQHSIMASGSLLHGVRNVGKYIQYMYRIGSNNIGCWIWLKSNMGSIHIISQVIR